MRGRGGGEGGASERRVRGGAVGWLLSVALFAKLPSLQALDLLVVSRDGACCCSDASSCACSYRGERGAFEFLGGRFESFSSTFVEHLESFSSKKSISFPWCASRVFGIQVVASTNSPDCSACSDGPSTLFGAESRDM